MKKCNYIFIVFVSVLLFVEAGLAQSGNLTVNATADSMFDVSLELFNNNDIPGAENGLKKIIGLPFNQKTTAAIYMLGKIKTDLKNYDNAEIYIDKLQTEYPESKYLPAARFLSAQINYERKLYTFALQELMWVINNSVDHELVQRSVQKFINIFEPDISERFYNDLLERYQGDICNDLINIKLAQLSVYKAEFSKSRSIIEKIENSFNYDPVKRAVDDIDSMIKNELEGDRYIAFLFPFKGEYSDIGRRVYQGAQFALEELSNDLIKLKLKPIDTGSSPANIPNILKSISEDLSIVGVVGPIDPDGQIIAASLAPVYKIPLIIPTYNDEISIVNSGYVFNLLGNSESEGKAIAQFAMEQLGYSNFAVISPIGGPEEKMADDFALEIEKLNGTVHVHEYYYPGTVDYKNQFVHIRRIGNEIQKSDSLRLYLRSTMIDTSDTENTDSLEVEQPVTQIIIDNDTLDISDNPLFEIALLDTSKLDSLVDVRLDSLTMRQLDSLWLVYEDTLESRRKDLGIKLDTLDYAVTAFDAIYMPLAFKEDIDFIVNQFAYYNFDAALLGNQKWYDLEMLERVNRNIRNMYLTNEYFDGDLYEPWAEFRNRFRESVGESPGDYELYGYDSMLLAIKAVRSYMLTRDGFWETLSSINELSGSPRGEIIFDSSHQKSNWHIVEYYRSIFRLAEINKNIPEKDKN